MKISHCRDNTRYFLIYSVVDGYMEYFCLLSIRYIVAVSIMSQAFLWTCVFLSLVYSQVVLWEADETSKQISKVSAPCYIPVNNI